MPRPSDVSRRHVRGVTLLELMAVVAIVGLLAMIAAPAYRQYALRAHRVEAKAALLALATNQERFYLTHRTYSADPAEVGFASRATERGTYALAIAGATAAGYAATATPRDGGAFDMRGDDQCTSFSITAQGVRTATGTAAASCW